MGTSQDLAPDGGQPNSGQRATRAHRGGLRALTVLGYLALFLLGGIQGLIGSFQYSQPPTPVIAIVFIVVIFATCVASGWGAGTLTAGLMPAVGWLIAAFVLASPRSNGSVIITATTAGEWFLYGGVLAAAAGAVTSFFVRLRRSSPRPR